MNTFEAYLNFFLLKRCTMKKFSDHWNKNSTSGLKKSPLVTSPFVK